MANRIGAGSLVCMGRRNVKGQGIVLERVKNVNEYAQFDLVDAWLKLYDSNYPDYLFKGEKSYSVLWSLRTDTISRIRKNIQNNSPKVNNELVKEFFGYNTAFSYQKSGAKITKLKTDFSLVKWYKAPSNYGDEPSQWFKSKQLWHPTKLLKNL